jgi:replicative DNA helicase
MILNLNFKRKEMKYTNQEAEQIILGSALMNNQYLLRVVDFLEEKHFYFEEHKAIWKKFIEVANNMIANEITLKDFFANNEHLQKIGGVNYLSTLLIQATGVIDIRDYGFTLVELWQKREMEILLQKSLADLNDKSFDLVLAEFENESVGLAIREAKKKTQHVSEIINEIEEDQRRGLSDKFMPTGFNNLDNLLNGGIHSQQLVIIGARPSVGKTTLAQNIILNSSKTGKKCLFVSLEVDKRNVTLKFLSNLCSIPAWKIGRNLVNQAQNQDLNRAKSELRQMAIYTNDSSYLRVAQIGQIIKNQIQKQPVDLVVVDYIQIIKGDDPKGKNEALIIKENTTMLKALAKQYDVGILALAQINRKAVEGANQEPTINDFKSSGGIEEDADVAIILHRDRSEEKKESYFSESGKLIVAKNRHGRTGEIAITFDGNFGRFIELENLF